GGGATIGRALVAAVKSRAVVVTADDALGPQRVGGERAAGGLADVLLAQPPRRPVGRARLGVVGQGIVRPLDEVGFPALRARLGRGGQAEADVGVRPRLLRRGRRGDQEEGEQGRQQALQAGQHETVPQGETVREPWRSMPGRRPRQGSSPLSHFLYDKALPAKLQYPVLKGCPVLATGTSLPTNLKTDCFTIRYEGRALRRTCKARPREPLGKGPTAWRVLRVRPRSAVPCWPAGSGPAFAVAPWAAGAACT